MNTRRRAAVAGIVGLAALVWLTWAGDEPAVAQCLVETFGEGRGPPLVTADGRMSRPGLDLGPIPGEIPPSEVRLDRPASDPLWEALRAWETAHPSAGVRYVRGHADPRRTCGFDEAMQGFVGEAPCVARDRAMVRVLARRPWSRTVDVYVATEAPDHPFAFDMSCHARRSWWGWVVTLEDGAVS